MQLDDVDVLGTEARLLLDSLGSLTGRVETHHLHAALFRIGIRAPSALQRDGSIRKDQRVALFHLCLEKHLATFLPH